MPGTRDRRRVRVRKARTTSVLHCGHLVRVGDQIVSTNRGPWRCMPCALATVRASHTIPEVLSEEARRDA